MTDDPVRDILDEVRRRRSLGPASPPERGPAAPPEPDAAGGWELRDLIRDASPVLSQMLTGEFGKHLPRREKMEKLFGAAFVQRFGAEKETLDGYLGRGVARLAEEWFTLPSDWREASATWLAGDLVDQMTAPAARYELRFLPTGLDAEWQALSAARRAMIGRESFDILRSTADIGELAATPVRVFLREPVPGRGAGDAGPRGDAREMPVPDESMVTGWMARYAAEDRRAGRKVKRDAAVAECRRATGATARQAIRAYRSLPAEDRYERGRPTK